MEEIDELMGLNAGADDYIRKPFSQRLLLERVRAVLRRAEGKPAPGSLEPKIESLVRGNLALDPQRHECTWDGKPVRLTVTEFLILQALAQAGKPVLVAFRAGHRQVADARNFFVV